MTFTEAAAEVLRQVGRPLHYKEITAYAIEKSLLSHVGKSPEVTMGARLAALFKKQGDENPLVRVRPGVFALKAWEESGELKSMVEKPKPTARTVTAPEPAPEPEQKPEAVEEPKAEPEKKKEPEDDAAVAPTRRRPARRKSRAAEKKEAEAAEPAEAEQPAKAPAAPASEETEPAKAEAAPEPETVQPEEPSQPEPAPEAPAEEAAAEAYDQSEQAVAEPDADTSEESERSELAAGASAVFEEEDDDDQPILAAPEPSSDRESSRRRRRRRRRPKNSQDANGAAYSASPSGPTDATHADGTVVETRPLAATTGGPHPVVLEVGNSSLEHVALDDFGGKDMADAIAIALGAADRAAGPVSLRQLAETAQRRGKLSGDLQQLQSQIAAAVRADNLRRTAAGQRPRFRFVGGRVALTDWLLNNDLARLEQEAVAAVERYRDAARKAFVRKLQELPGHAFVELVLLVLERVGFHHVRAVRRAGIPGNEAHFTALHDTGAGHVQSALVIRRDGREIGRERVTELRGAFHHYGPATVGWLVTSGPVLSGAREEAAANNAAAVVLFDGFGVAKLCETHDIAVVRATLPVCIPDLDVLEALRSS